MQPLGILLLNSARRWIGEAAHTLALARELERQGHRVTIGVRADHELERHAREARLRHVLPLAMNSRFLPLGDLRDCLKIRRVVVEEKIDLVHCNRGKDHWLAASAHLLFSPGRRPALVRSRHVVTRQSRHLLNRWLYRFATDGLLSVSGAARDSLGPLSALARVEQVILSAVDSDLFAPEKRNGDVRRDLGAENKDDILIGLVGRIQRVKGQRCFLEAAAEVARQNPRARFVLAGRGSKKQVEDLLRHADTVGLDRGRVRILGMLPNLPEVMAAFDIGVVASIGSEGSSRVTLEYMASGVPVVATRVGGIPELIEDEVQGLLLDPGDAAAMARLLRTLIENPVRRAYLGENGRRTTLEQHTLDRWGKQIAAFYRTVIESRAGCPRK